MSKRPHLVIVGGFLGAGKTTLILTAARILATRGLRSAIILNDQGKSLVDTGFAQSSDFLASEVTGGCFCCRFSELIGAAEALREHSPDMIFAELVGSCTDLSATILQPIQESYLKTFQLAPLTLVVDPGRARRLDDPDIAFLFQKQLEEADLVCFTKSDLYPDPPSLPAIASRQISGRTGQGVAAWLDEVTSGALPFRGVILDIDYERYAQAEAALAWLNAEADFDSETPLSPAMLLGPLLDHLDGELTKARIPIVHLKALDHAPTGWVKVAICGNREEPAAEGMLHASPAVHHHLLLNLRASGDPEAVRAVVEAVLSGLPGRFSSVTLRCFRPSAPKPERRMTEAARSTI